MPRTPDEAFEMLRILSEERDQNVSCQRWTFGKETKFVFGNEMLREMTPSTIKWLDAMRTDIMALVNTCEHATSNDAEVKILGIDIQTCTEAGVFIKNYLKRNPREPFLRILGFYDYGNILVGINIVMMSELLPIYAA